MGVRGLVGVELVADNGQPASLHSGNYGNIVPNPVLPLARLIDDIEDARSRVVGESHDAFRREASELFAKWEDRAVWTPFLQPHGEHQPLHDRRRLADRAAHDHPPHRPRAAGHPLTPDTPPAAMSEIVAARAWPTTATARPASRSP